MARLKRALPGLLLLLGCTTGGPAPTTLSAAELREGCVALTLDLLQEGTDLFASAAGVRDLQGLVQVAAQGGCALVVDAGGGEHLLSCGDLVARLLFLRDGRPVDDPRDADRLRVALERVGAVQRTEATLDLTLDPSRGVVVEGLLYADTADGCTVDATLDNVTVRLVADLPNGGSGAIFLSGNVDLGVRHGASGIATGTAALVGRSALVSLEVGGVYTQGEVVLGGE